MSDDQSENTGNEQDTTEAEAPPETSEEGSRGSSGTDENESTSNASSKTPQESKSFTNVCTDFVRTVYKDRYYRQIMKSVMVFLVALKMAQESRMLLVPLKEYEPFGK